MKRWHTLFRFFCTAAAAGCLAGCVREESFDPATVNPERTVTIRMRVPVYELPDTRSIGGNKGEAVVQTIDLLIFDQQTAPPMLLTRYQATNIRQSRNGPYYEVSFDVALEEFVNARTLAVFANARDAVDHALSNPAGTEDGDKRKPNLMSYARYIPTEDPETGYKWKAAEDDYTPIPMYGEVVVEGGITENMEITGLELTRAMARIDVENQVEGSVFNLKEIHLVNYEAGGGVVPVYNPITGVLYKSGDSGYIYDQNIDPNIPTYGTRPPVSKAIKYTYEQGSGPGPLLAGEIYTFEARSVTVTNPALRVGLILRGDYRGTDTYYRVDFTTNRGGALGAGEVVRMPLYRNHLYTVTITAAEGVGYKTFDEALRSETVLSNLKTSILAIDLAGLNNIVYNGQYYMGVETRSIDIPWSSTQILTYAVKSNYTGPWEARLLDPEDSWIQFYNGGVSASGTNISAAPFSFILMASDHSASARVEFTAGRLRDTLTIRRVPLASMFARSNVVLRSGMLTFAVTEEDNRAIPAWSEGVLFKWGSLFALSPAGVPYAPGTVIVYNPNTGAFNPILWGDQLAGWDQIRYAHPDFGFTATTTGDDADAFKSYNTLGFDSGTGIGDICRYISSRTGGKGWVQGDWRLPTYAELEALYQETFVRTAKSGTFTDLTATLDASPSGSSDPESGWFLGAGVTASTPGVPANRATPPEGTLFLPATGHRYPNGAGDMVHVGAYAYYWSSTPYTQFTVNYLFQNKYGVYFTDADRSYAFPVRCIKDY